MSAAQAVRWSVLFWLLFVAAPVQARPTVLVIVADHLTLADVLRPDLPGLAWLRQGGQIALMSPGVAHGFDPVATVYATLGAGDSVPVGSVSQGRMDSSLRAAGIRTALIGNADGDDTGPYRPAQFLLPFPDLVSDPTVADARVPGGRRTDPPRLLRQIAAAARTCPLEVVDFGDFERLEREQQQGDLTPYADAQHRDADLSALSQLLLLLAAHPAPVTRILLVVPTPPLNAQGRWDRLTPLLLKTLVASAGASGDTVISDTTQTPGLVAARDVAPTVLSWLGVAAPLQMTGAVMQPTSWPGPGNAAAGLRALNRQTRLNQEAQNPLFWGLGLLAPAVIFPLLAFYWAGRLMPKSRLCRIAPYAMRLLAAWPLALLLVPLLHPASLDAYLGLIATATAVIALLPSPSLIFSVTALVLIADGLTGTHLVSQSVLSAYALAGIRFYGIGNEYMGLLLGGALLAAAAWSPAPETLPDPNEVWSRRRTMSAAVLLWFALVTFVLSFPAFGAKAGGAVTATAIFTLAWLRLRGVRLTARHFFFGIAAGFALVFLWAGIGDVFHLRRTHLATAVGALQRGRFGYIGGIALRKIGLAARVFLHPGTLLGVLALALMALAARALFRRSLSAFYAVRPRLAAVSEAGLWGCGICILFNDSGIVAAILLAMCLILPVLHGLFQESCVSLPSMSEMSGSASPSVTP